MIDKKDLAKLYFELFSQKDLKTLSELFSLNVSLIDWDINVKGIDEVVNANKQIFDSVKTISVKVLKLADVGATVFAQLKITIDETTILKVVDIIEFDSNNKIASIKAYKQ